MNLGQWLRIRERLTDDYPEDDDRQMLLRAKEYVDNHMYRADVVPQIPPSAPPGYFMVTAGDPNLYVGTGNGVRKIPTQAV